MGAEQGRTPPEIWEARVSRWLAWAAGLVILVGCAGLITIDVVTRFLFNRTVVESFEIGGYAFATAVTLGLAYALTGKAHIRVDLIQVRLPHRARVMLDVVAHFALAACALALAWYCLGTWLQSWKLGAKSISTMQLPMVWPQGFWLVGVLWFALVATTLGLRALIALARGDLRGIERMVGAAKLEDELEGAGVALDAGAERRP